MNSYFEGKELKDKILALKNFWYKHESYYY